MLMCSWIQLHTSLDESIRLPLLKFSSLRIPANHRFYIKSLPWNIVEQSKLVPGNEYVSDPALPIHPEVIPGWPKSPYIPVTFFPYASKKCLHI